MILDNLGYEIDFETMRVGLDRYGIVVHEDEYQALMAGGADAAAMAGGVTIEIVKSMKQYIGREATDILGQCLVAGLFGAFAAGYRRAKLEAEVASDLAGCNKNP